MLSIYKWSPEHGLYGDNMHWHFYKTAFKGKVEDADKVLIEGD